MVDFNLLLKLLQTDHLPNRLSDFVVFVNLFADIQI
jgi:hypothetical protein